MLLNLKTEIARNKLSAAKIAKGIGMSEYTFSRKILCKNDFTRKEMYLIHSKFFPECDFYELFKEEKEKGE